MEGVGEGEVERAACILVIAELRGPTSRSDPFSNSGFDIFDKGDVFAGTSFALQSRQ